VQKTHDNGRHVCSDGTKIMHDSKWWLLSTSVVLPKKAPGLAVVEAGISGSEPAC